MDGILLSGSNGEFFTLSGEERARLTEAAAAVTKGRVKLIVGTGANAVAETVGLSHQALDLGADAVMLGSPLARAEEAPGKGMHWGAEARHQTLPRGFRTNVGTVGTLEDIMFGPSHNADGTTNYIGALRRAMATTGYVDLKSFQRCPVTVAPTR